MAFDLKASPIRRRVWRTGRFFLLAAGLLATFGVFFFASMKVAIRAREVKVPDLRGRSVAEAQAALTDAGLVIRVDDVRRSDPKVPADHILSQEPEPGTVLRRQRGVRVRVSDGQRDPILPNVADTPERTAEIMLAGESISIEGRAEVVAPSLEPGTVIAQDPPAKQRSGKVTLLINRGDKNVSYVMPDLIGTLEVRATTILRAQGFRVGVAAEVAYPGLPPGFVVKQTPQAGYQVRFGEAITLEVTR